MLIEQAAVPHSSEIFGALDWFENRRLEVSVHCSRITGSSTQRVLQRDNYQCAIKELGLCRSFDCEAGNARVDVHHIIPKQVLRHIREQRPEIPIPMNHPGGLISLCRPIHERLHQVDPDEAKQYFNPDSYAGYCSEPLIEELYLYLERQVLNVDPRLDKLFLRTVREKNVAVWSAGLWTHLPGQRHASILQRIGE